MGKVSDYQQAADANVIRGDVESTSFVENMSTSFKLFLDEDMSISRFLNNEVFDERDRELDGLIASNIEVRDAAESVSSWTGVNYDALSRHLKRNGHDVQDDIDLRGSVRETLRERREHAQDVMSRSTGMGTAGQFIGTIGAASMDPVNIAAMFVAPAMLARGASVLAAVGKGAKIGAMAGAGAETLIQPLVFDWKAEIDSPYSATDALINIAAAGAGGATLEGLLTGGRQLFINAGRVKLTGDPSLDKIIESDVEELMPEIIEAGEVAKTNKATRVIVEDRASRMEELELELAEEVFERELATEVLELDEAEIAQWRRDMEVERVYDDAEITVEEVAEVIEIVEAKTEQLIADDKPEFADFDEDRFADMSTSERDAYVEEQLGMVYGEDNPLDEATLPIDNFDDFEYGGTVEGAMTREDYMSAQDDIVEAIDEFRGCWGGG